MNRNIVYIATVCFLIMGGGIFMNIYPQQVDSSLAPLIIDEKAKEVRFSATMKTNQTGCS